VGGDLSASFFKQYACFVFSMEDEMGQGVFAAVELKRKNLSASARVHQHHVNELV
jgi:serine phosphatase RsbU (regulator of sigma subunit)